jgi:hypothetical protein
MEQCHRFARGRSPREFTENGHGRLPQLVRRSGAPNSLLSAAVRRGPVGAPAQPGRNLAR